MYYVYQSLTVLALWLLFTQGSVMFGNVADVLAWRSTVTESSADARCRNKWIPMARNDVALKCYITQDLARFCRQEERNHLAWLIDQYMAEEKAYGDALSGYVFRTAVYANAPHAQDQDPMKRLDAATRKAAEPLMTPEFKKAMNADVIPAKEMTVMFRRLVKSGLIVRDDLNWTVPQSVENAFVPEQGKAPPRLAACRQAT